jgi:hypothetical protein
MYSEIAEYGTCTYIFLLLRMIDNVISQDIDLSSRDTLYSFDTDSVLILLLLLLLTANGFSPGGSGTTITQQTDNSKNTLLQ